MNGHKHAPRGRIKAVEATEEESLDTVDASKGKCTAHSSRTGLPCKRWAILGGTVCPTHGGSLPQVKRKAEERLAALVDPAITRLGELIKQKEYPSTAITAVNSALDRAMGKAIDRQAVKIQGTLVIRHELAD